VLIALQRFDEAERTLLEAVAEDEPTGLARSRYELRERNLAIETAAELYEARDRPAEARAMRARIH
jgi:hypothetical protein